MHTLILGMTESGKTTLAKMLAQEYRENGINVIVLDPLRDDWPADFATTDAAEFLRVVKSSRGCAVFVDEAGETVGRYDEEMTWLATRGRHYGHACHFIAQRAQLINTTARNQCAAAYIFNVSANDSKLLSDEFNKEKLRQCHALKRGEFFKVGRFSDAEKFAIDFGSKDCYKVKEEY